MTVYVLKDAAWLEEQCKTKTIKQIAAELSCRTETVRSAVQRFNLTPQVNTCRHCGRPQPLGCRSHEQCCIHNPKVSSLTKQYLDDGTGCIKTRNRYRVDAMNTGAARPEYLTEVFGSWPKVAQFYGLSADAKRKPRMQLIDSEDNVDIFTEADKAYLSECAQTLATETYGGEGLTVCRVIETRNEVRYMLR